MADTSIEWATKVWNPLRGCSKVSEGCQNCYAMRQAHRFSGPGMPYEGLTRATEYGPQWTGKVKLVPDMLVQPLKWKRSERIFVNSMSDLFHEDAPFPYIAAVFGAMAASPNHNFQVLTKRPKRMLEWFDYIERMAEKVSDVFPDDEKDWRHRHVLRAALIKHLGTGGIQGIPDPAQWPLPNVWLGVSVENQKAADERIPLLLQTPAAVKFLSMEPLLGPVNLNRVKPKDKNDVIIDALKGDYLVPFTILRDRPKIDWVIVGGESGHKARAMHPEWVRSIRDQCQTAGVPFFFKQWGEFEPYVDEDKFTHCGEETQKNMQWYVNPDGSNGHCWLVDGDGTWQNWTGDPQEDCHVMNRVGKKAAGRLLDGRTWDKFPEVRR
jgi:protein gp37